MVNTLENHLKKNKVDKELAYLIKQISNAGKEIYRKMKTAKFSYTKNKNSTGDTQLNFDIICDKIIEKFLMKSGFVHQFVSEERDKVTVIKSNAKSLYMVAFDPLDGSSVTSANLSVGSCFSIFPAANKFEELTGKDILASIYIVYGPNLKLGYSTGNGTHIFKMNSNGYFVLESENIILKEEKYCSIGGMQNANKNKKEYMKYLEYFVDNSFKVRASGSLTSDVHHILTKNGGIYIYPYKKLRLLYECFPHAFLIQNAGGTSKNLKEDILSLKCKNIHEEHELICGGKEIVEDLVN